MPNLITVVHPRLLCSCNYRFLRFLRSFINGHVHRRTGLVSAVLHSLASATHYPLRSPSARLSTLRTGIDIGWRRHWLYPGLLRSSGIHGKLWRRDRVGLTKLMQTFILMSIIF